MSNSTSFYFIFIMRSLFIRYKKLRAVLAMERTKPIYQNKQQKKPYSNSSAITEITLRLKPLACYSFRKKYKRNFNAQNTSLSHAFYKERC